MKGGSNELKETTNGGKWRVASGKWQVKYHTLHSLLRGFFLLQLFIFVYLVYFVVHSGVGNHEIHQIHEKEGCDRKGLRTRAQHAVARSITVRCLPSNTSVSRNRHPNLR